MATEASKQAADAERKRPSRANIQREVRPEVLRYSETAAFLNIGETLLWNLQREADFPRPVQLGPRARGWLRDDLIAWLHSRKKEAA